jgi:hypothetical protein
LEYRAVEPAVAPSEGSEGDSSEEEVRTVSQHTQPLDEKLESVFSVDVRAMAVEMIEAAKTWPGDWTGAILLQGLVPACEKISVVDAEHLLLASPAEIDAWCVCKAHNSNNWQATSHTKHIH